TTQRQESVWIKKLKIYSWNVKGLGHLVKKKKIISSLKTKKCDIAYLQETHLMENEIIKLHKDWVGHIYYASGSSKSRGVAILIHKKLQFKCLNFFTDNNGRMVVLKAEVQGIEIIFANIYAPNLDDPSFCSELEYKILQLQNSHILPIILGGDFNQIIDNILDCNVPSTTRRRKAVEIMQNVSHDINLVDVWRLMNLTVRDYTFYSACHKVYTRIDYFLISQVLLPSVESCDIGPILISDHAQVGVYMSTLVRSEKSLRWRFNNSLLKDTAFIGLMKREIDLFKETNLSSAPSPGSILQYASYKKKMKNKDLQILENEVTVAEKAYKMNMSNDNLHQLLQLKYKYNTLLSQKIEFLLLRARQKHFEEGDKAGSMLANYIKQQEAQSVIPAICDYKGEIHTSPKSINRAFEEFYQNLYKSESSATKEEIEFFLNKLCLPRLSNTQKNIFDVFLLLASLRRSSQ
uniref:exodeoxyribonuclease III n=1 Tax=Acanthochromis polyacanthus TaxID=80966 RepID=A0A3Q1GUH1_9TELE